MGKEVTHLQNPDALALSDAYRTMLKNSEINLFISIDNLVETLHTMETVGFIGMMVAYQNTTTGSANITAFKAKNGPCYDTGRFVIYNGAALAVLDDDNHLLIAGKETAVCEKTANIYKLSVYEKHLTCTNTDPVLLENLNSQPTPFNCDTFEGDNEKLFQMVREPETEAKLVSMFYPGPFRLLVLSDGRIIHRGEVTSVSASDADLLIEKEGLFRSSAGNAIEPSFFKELFNLSGARCLLDNKLVRKNSEENAVTDFESLNNISEALKDQLLKLIKDNKKYFILTGSDINDKLGCCPSEMVTEANRLKRAGILDSFGQSAQDDSCTVTTYAFRNEINVVGNEPVFRIDSSFRLNVKDKLEKKKGGVTSQLLKWVLLGFIVISVIIAFLKFQGSSDLSATKSLYEQVSPVTENQKFIVLFHFKERCNLCLNMEAFTNDILNEYYPQLVKNGDVRFVLLTMDDPSNKGIVERLEITSATLVLVQFENKNEKKIIVLKDLWEYSQDELVFKEKLKKELDKFLSE
jgi:hypothetical protein